MRKQAPAAVATLRRRTLCEEAARIMLEHGVRDFQSAKEKACSRLGVPWNQAWLPSNKEIEQALLIRQRLFHGGLPGRRMVVLLQLALDLMQALANFRPRLSGTLPRGHATERTPVELHLFSDDVESIAWKLYEDGIPYDNFDKRFRVRAAEYQYVPGFRFFADDTPVELLAFSYTGERQAPLCPVSGRPVIRADVGKVRELLEREMQPGI